MKKHPKGSSTLIVRFSRAWCCTRGVPCELRGMAGHCWPSPGCPEESQGLGSGTDPYMSNLHQKVRDEIQLTWDIGRSWRANYMIGSPELTPCVGQAEHAVPLKKRQNRHEPSDSPNFGHIPMGKTVIGLVRPNVRVQLVFGVPPCSAPTNL